MNIYSQHIQKVFFSHLKTDLTQKEHQIPRTTKAATFHFKIHISLYGLHAKQLHTGKYVNTHICFLC